jgi:hypothetical protein
LNARMDEINLLTAFNEPEVPTNVEKPDLDFLIGSR